MIGIVLAAHGPLSGALLETSGMIIGELPNVSTVSLMPDDSLEGLMDRLRSSVEEVESGDGVLILLDLSGGTPANAAALLTQKKESVHAVAGVNLGMLLEILMARMNITEGEVLAQTAVSAGQAGIINIVEALSRFREDEHE